MTNFDPEKAIIDAQARLKAINADCERINRETGENLRAFREKHGLSLRDMGEALSLSKGYLSDLERGRRGWSVALVGSYLKAVTPTELVR